MKKAGIYYYHILYLPVKGGSMIDINMLKPLIHSIFQQSGSTTLSKQSIISKLSQIPQAQQFLPFLNKLQDRNDYTENSVNQEVQNVQQKQGGSVVNKIKEKVGF
jgi:hypothetical protein